MTIFDEIIKLFSDNQLKEGQDFKIIQHEPEGQSDKICKIRGNKLHEGAKAMLMMGVVSKKDKFYFLAVLPADMSVDFNSLTQLTNVKKVIFAPIEKVKELTGCEIGSVPPFSFNQDIKVMVDSCLINDNKTIAFNAGRLDRSVIMNVVDYEKIAKNFGYNFWQFGILKTNNF